MSYLFNHFSQRIFIIVTLSLLLTGCGSKNVNSTATVKTESNKEFLGTPVKIVKKTGKNPEEILRSELDEVLAKGPANILSMVLTSPHMENGKFAGFKLVEFTSEEPKSLGFVENDVILLVNGRKLERPEDLFELFEDLKTAKALKIKILRNDETIYFDYPIVDK